MEDERKRAKLRAMHLLERADRTEEGLRQKLLQNYSEEIVREALEYVKAYGYVDDARYAQNYIRYRRTAKSRRQLLAELRQKGVDAGTAAEAWEQVQAEEAFDEREALRGLLLRKYAPGSRLEEGQLRRILGYLGRRGFSWEDIRAVMEEENIRQGE